MNNAFHATEAGDEGEEMAVVTDPQMPTGTEVASYETYAQARAGVDFLSDAGFDVSAITIVGSDLHLVERAGRFLAVAADKGDRRPFAEQTHGPLHLVQRNLQSSGYDLFDHVRKNVLRQR